MENRSSSLVPFDLNAFLGAMAHDLANPLNAISMNTELVRLLVQKNQTARVPEIVERVLADCARCSRFLRDLRQFGDATKDRPRERVSLQALVDAAEIGARALVSGKFPEIQLSAGETTFSAERQSMEAAISAILRNAAEAGARVLRITARSTDRDIHLLFADDGGGFGEASVNKALTPFFSTRRQEGNTGLGLALCAYVVSAHSGELTVQNGPEGGAEVRIKLPA